MSKIGFIFVLNKQSPISHGVNYKDKILLNNLSILIHYNKRLGKSGIFLNEIKQKQKQKRFNYGVLQTYIADTFGVNVKLIEDINPIPTRFLKKHIIYCVVLKHISPFFTEFNIFKDTILLQYNIDQLDLVYDDLFTSINNYYSSKEQDLSDYRTICVFNQDTPIFNINLSDIISGLVGLLQLRDDIKHYLK
jgi:hypothetical protein